MEEQIRIYKNPIHPRRKLEVATDRRPDDELKCKDRSMKNSINRTKNMIYDLARCNHWEWFVTLTFNPKKVDTYNYCEVSKKIKNFLDKIRRENPNMAYIGVPELHKKGDYHFHFLMSGVENLTFSDSGRKCPKGRVIYNILDYTLGFTTSTRIDDSAKASSYITKYITKTLHGKTEGKKRYWHSRNLKVPDEFRYMLSPGDIEELKEFVKEKTTSHKVVSVKTPDFSNEIEYIEVCSDIITH